MKNKNIVHTLCCERICVVIYLCLFSIHSLANSSVVSEVSNIDQNISENYRALIIGNNEYKDPSGFWKSLSTPVKDAQSVSNILRDNYGFESIELLINATRREIFKALETMANSAKANDSVLIYYAGHGYYDEAGDIGYWVPVDGEGQEDSTFISNSRIREKVKKIVAKAKNTLLISDACFSGSLFKGGSRGLAFKLRNKQVQKSDDLHVEPNNIQANDINTNDNIVQTNIPGIQSEAQLKVSHVYEKLASRKSAQLLSSGGVEFVDDNYDNKGHSPYTYYLLKELSQTKQPYLSASELGQNIQKTVAANVIQTPQYGSIFNVGHEGGEFVFQKLANVPTELGDPPKQTNISPGDSKFKNLETTQEESIFSNMQPGF